MDVSEIKENIQALVTKLDTIEEDDYDGKKLHNEFIKPFFETLGWDFQTDVKIPTSITENKADYAFQIDGVSRFYLNVLPPSASLENRKQILSLTTFAYNKGVTWAIQTNFKEFRVYNTEAPGTTPASMQHYAFSASEYVSEYEKLLDLTKKQFSLNVLDSDAEFFGKKPKRIPIDQQLLKDLLSYRNIIANEIKNNNSIPEEHAEEYAQKILNRLIFIRSCGDRQIEERHLKSMLGDWNDNKNKKLIEHLQEIFAYFRGRYGSSLFEKHACDNSIIRDHILEEIIEGLYKSKEKSLSYDFSLITSDVLGKMYENYLGTIQRKQDGAYYTPNYISKYIAENTIIPYLSKSDVTTIPDLITEYADNIEELESKIHNIKILDPACGTGEFLIRAIDVLLKISKGIQTQKEKTGQYLHTGKKKKSESVAYTTFDKDIENQQLRTIIQNNIHGVDINEEAIEISELNLFLKLATSSKQLPDISKNLRVGNSLVDDKSVDPKAFDWEKTFPEKFDIVIGNPPYLNIKGLHESHGTITEYLKENFESATERFDFYVLFVEKCSKLLRKDGYLSFITPHKFFNAQFGKGLRQFLINSKLLSRFISFGYNYVFDSSTTYTGIITLNNIKNTKFLYAKIDELKFGTIRNDLLQLKQKDFAEFFIDTFDKKPWTLTFGQTQIIFNKIKTNGINIMNFFDMVMSGLQTAFNDLYILTPIKNKKNTIVLFSKIKQCQIEIEKDILKPILMGKDVKRYDVIKSIPRFVIYPYVNDAGNQKPIEEEVLKKNYPLAYKYLFPFKKDLINLRTSFKTNPKYWHGLHRARKLERFEQEKIITPEISLGCNMTIDSDKFLHTEKVYSLLKKPSIKQDLRYFLAILNSKLMWFFIKNTGDVLRGGYFTFKTQYITPFSIPLPSKDIEKNLIELVNEIFRQKNNSLVKQKNADNMTDIDTVESKIDELVYKLYNITEEEKKIIESI